MRLKISVDAFAERVRPEVVLDHAQHRRALVVRDGVEGLVDLRGRVDGRVHGPCRLQRVEPERSLVHDGFVDRDVPLGPHGCQRAIFHPVGEAFVQPDVVPPLHRDEIAEPLMRHLVREHRGDALADSQRGVLRVDEKIALAIEDRRRVFHRARREVGDGEDVELAVGIFDGEVGVVELEDLLRRVERDATHLLLAFGAADANRNAVGRAFGARKPAHGHRHQIRRHLRCRRKRDEVAGAVGGWRVGDHPAVGERHVATVDRQRDVEGRLEGWLVEARECASRVGRLELRDGVALVVLGAEIEAAQLVVEDAAVADVDLRAALRQRLRHREGCGLTLFVERDGRRLPRRAAFDRDLAERDFRRVEDDRARRLRDVDTNRFRPVEARLGEVDVEAQVVVTRGHPGRQALGRRGGGDHESKSEGGDASQSAHGGTIIHTCCFRFS